MKIQDLSRQAVTAIIPLYQITPLSPSFLETEIFYFTPFRTRDTDNNAIDIEFDGNTYTPVPISVVDRHRNEINLEVDAPDDFISMCLDNYDNFVGAEVTILYVLKEYIDDPDNTAGLGRELYTMILLEHRSRELASWRCSKDLFVRRSRNFPTVEVNKTYCPYKYRYWETPSRTFSDLSYSIDTEMINGNNEDVLIFSGATGSFSYDQVFDVGEELRILYNDVTYGPYEIASVSTAEDELVLIYTDITVVEGATTTIQDVPMDVEFFAPKFIYPPGKEVCPYVGTTYFDINGNEVTDPQDDVASKHESTCCAVRFPEEARPFGGFLGVRDIR